MAAAAEVQALLRFLTKDAKIPLAEAMPKINDLRKQQLNTPENISTANQAALKSVFTDDKVLKQVLTAAKRVSNPKKRTLAQTGSPTSKRVKTGSDMVDDESALELPETALSLDEIEHMTIETNRAPLFLAFTIAVLAYTHSEQPLSSRWSLAQAVVSAGAQSKAKYLGITPGPTAEEDGWAQGQPKVKIMGREIAVLRRHVASKSDEAPSTPTTAFWGLDLEALRRSNGPLIGARNYLLRSMIVVDSGESKTEKEEEKPKPAKKSTPKDMASNREAAAAIMLKAIDTVCQSWASSLSLEELDQRAQRWYVHVRPDVEHGQAGWGQRGKVQLKDILKLKKE
ncbi:hypothetical protein LTR99_010920 [Exophiala xenobiotica]|uniref:MAGE domain-containing protein n=1 Tax=Vermiconidia calcicola TaxID=1690605 RepID=A0AAV9PQU6_9PEZI|nr:hypothetical protein LTR92_009931 [Exophiala xenobiotica]KAK5527967.1 hypothetical protein LTR25_010766 [Vermiconidia calcicola]KAK5529321.1 hypothetical protein LTR23_010755 [Chaetothyriales sp. CCFEE 6169]KAK5203450.1 hypothetical protein LTR41_010813 [Exophiala xenobiotica]KAK5216632.1 hypothetical protein LTR72_010300 [Exophiala xenobiotica]